jgi:antitoxin YefM
MATVAAGEGMAVAVLKRNEPAFCRVPARAIARQIISFSEARKRFKAVLDRVAADADVALITRRHAQCAVVMSLDTYNSLMGTVHRLRSPANAAHLQRSLEQAERGELLAYPLIEADPLVAGS